VFPGIADCRLEVIELEFPTLESLYEEGKTRLRDVGRPEIESTFVAAYKLYISHQK
jgi:hypothetical protein